MELISNVNGVKKYVGKSAITLDRLYESDFQKEGTITAQIRQTVTTESHYPSKKVDSNMQANIFDSKDFGFTDQIFTSHEARVAWIPVPVNATLEQVQAKLAAAAKSGATIYRVLSNAPILDANQEYAITQGIRTKDDFANSQVVRVPENEETVANGTANKLLLDPAGRVQYRRTFFWLTKQEDQDLRGKAEPYLSAEIKAELQGASVLQGQTI